MLEKGKILATIQKEIGIFEGKRIKHNPQYASTQKDIINLIDLYWSDRYRDNWKDSLGYKKPFYNIIESPTLVAVKQVDLDTKNVQIKAEEGQSYYPAWLLSKEFQMWMKETQFAELLNKITYNLPKYGAVVLKKIKDEIYFVPIQNLYMESWVESLNDSTFVIEEHDYIPETLKAQNWDKKKIKEAIKKFADKKNHITVYERYGAIEGTEDNYFIVAGKKEESFKEGYADVILFQDKVKELPYKEVHWDKVEGRWMGKGIPEKLFEAQIQTNRVGCYKAHSLYWTSKHIYQTRDPNVSKNLMTKVKNGRVLIVGEPITQVPVEERNLPAYRDSENRWDLLVDKRTFSWDTIRGQRSKSPTLGQSILETKMAGGFFDRKREEIGLFIKELIYDWIIPDFIAKKTKKHSIMLGEFNEDELDTLKKAIITRRTNKKIISYVGRNGIPDKQERELLKATILERMKGERGMEIPKDYYKNIKFKILIDITGERIDMGSKMTVLQTVLQIIGGNPTILQDRNTRKVFFELLNMAGISPTQFEAPLQTLEEAVPQVARMGGSVAKSMPSATPESINVPTTL